ncbi:DNA-binding response regulator [Beijerinckiaceae bacterium RH CH11]|nr:response regulator transcription factor [Beijerinckiaceae bacterium]VVB44732.1 DNA-binding response regulator [Beijerinckiaceae bacterium RH CH11]VVB44810.1 DNA-binding response regulator [Beijerinckiaceae bacterium RH AL8]
MNILIVDDHPVFRDGFAMLLQHVGEETIVHQAGNVAEGLQLIAAHPEIDVLMLDLFMPSGGGFPAIAEFGRARRDLPIIVLSSSEDPKDVRRALAMGALGYVPKSASPQVLLSAINLVLNGDIYVPPLILAGGPGNEGVAPEISDALTRRQIDVLCLLAEGLPNKTIATRLELSEKTVKAHVTAIFRALRVVNRTQAASAGRAAGLI